MNRRTLSAAIMLAIAAIFFQSTGCGKTPSKAPTKLVLKTAPGSPPMTIETDGGPAITMTAFVTKADIVIRAKWADASKEDTDTPWIFDGQKWTKGPGDDVLILVWNIDDSIEGFNSKGASIIKQTERPFARVRGFIIERNGSGQTVSRLKKQKGDIWDMALGLTNPLGIANDLIIKADPDYVKDPTRLAPLLTAQSDKYTKGTPWVKNAKPAADGAQRPAYKFRDGRDMANTPLPTLSDMVEIGPADTFSAGQRLPYYIYTAGRTWGGSMDDIKGTGVWKDSVWSVEMRRKLITGNDDDIQFKLKPGKNFFVFSVMVRDGDSKYYPGPPVSLEIDK